MSEFGSPFWFSVVWRMAIRLSGNKVGFQRLVLFELAHPHDAKANEVTLRVHTLHHGIVVGRLDIAGGVGKADFQEIRLRIKPDFYFIGHKSSPAFGLSVR